MHPTHSLIQTHTHTHTHTHTRTHTHTHTPRVVPYHGMVALACGYVVAVKQFHPDSVAFPPPAPPTLRVKVYTGLLATVFERYHYHLSSLSLFPPLPLLLASLHTDHHHSVHPFHISRCWLLFLLACLQRYSHCLDLPEILPEEGPRPPWGHGGELCLCYLLSRDVAATIGHTRGIHVSYTGLDQGLSKDCENVRCWCTLHHQADPPWDRPCRCTEKKVSRYTVIIIEVGLMHTNWC